MFDEIKWLCVFAKYTFITEPQSSYVSRLILSPFSPFSIECKKLIAKNLWKCIFRASRRATLSYFSYVNKLILTPFSPFSIECKKLIAKSLSKCIFRAGRTAMFSYFSTRSWEVTPTTPFRIFVDYVTIFNSTPMQNLRWDSL